MRPNAIRLRLVRFLLFTFPGILGATPGSVLESNFPRFSTQAVVNAAAAAADGSVFLSGDFLAIDGISRSGFAKLTPSGLLDVTFNPASENPVPTAWETPRLFPLPQGRLMYLRDNHWTLYDSDGSQNESLLPNIPRSGVVAPRAQFLTDERLFLIHGSKPILQAYRADDLSPDGAFTAADGPLPIYQAAPASDQKIWILGRSSFVGSSLFFSHTFTVFRLNSDGSLDASFTPLEMPEGYQYDLRPMADGGFYLIEEWIERYFLSPVPTARSLIAERFDAAGESLNIQSFAQSFSLPMESVILQSPNKVVRPSTDLRRVIRSQAGGAGVDSTFSVALAAPELPALYPLITKVLTQFPNGQLLVGGNRKLSSEGLPDPSWHIPRLTRKTKISKLKQLSVNRVLVCGDFDHVDDMPTAGMVVLDADDSVDPSFTPDFDGRFVQDVQSLPGGSLAIRFSVSLIQSDNKNSELVRLNSGGEFNSLLPVPEGDSGNFFSGNISDFSVRADGSILTRFDHRGGDIPSSSFRLIDPDGFLRLTVPNTFVSLGGFNQRSANILILNDGTFFRGSERFGNDGNLIEKIEALAFSDPMLELSDGSVIFTRKPFHTSITTLQRWHPESGVDANFVALSPRPSNLAIDGVIAASSSKLLVWGNALSASLVRLHSTGQIDPTFRPPHTQVTAALAESGDTILAATDGGLVRLDDGSANGFTDWMRATTAQAALSPNDLLPGADPDHDGSSNFFEYAASSDPFVADASRSQPRQTAAMTWRIFCNPEAPEISRRIETTLNLSRWSPARADEIRLETNRACLSWTLLPGQSKLFSRVIID